MTSTRALIVDDHAVFADALAEWLNEQPDLDVVGTATNTTEALKLLEEHACDVVALDLMLGDEDGLTVAREMLNRWPNLGVVMVTGLEDSTYILEAVQIGIRGWVSKTATMDALMVALRGVANGETHIPAHLLTAVLHSLADTRPTLTEAEGIRQLTSRELEVLACLVDGMSRHEMGELLHVSPNTVRTHVQSILHKLKVHSALSATAIARRAGITTADRHLEPGEAGAPR
jgi:DNA-binding NarL/FixJ family response regulator